VNDIVGFVMILFLADHADHIVALYLVNQFVISLIIARLNRQNSFVFEMSDILLKHNAKLSDFGIGVLHDLSIPSKNLFVLCLHICRSLGPCLLQLF